MRESQLHSRPADLPSAATEARTSPLAASLADHFPWLLGLYFTLQLVRRLLEPHGLGLDEAEQIVMAQAYAWGYGSQPPLYTWLQKGLFDLIGQSVFSLALLKNVVLFLTFLCFFHAATLVLGDRLKAAAATLSLFFVPQIAWESQRALVHTPAAVCAASATLLCFLHLVLHRRTRDYVFFGAVIAAGVLCKYNYVIFAACLLAAAMLIRTARPVLFDKRMFLVALPVAVVAMLPTFLWSLANQDLVYARSEKFGPDVELPLSVAWSRGLSELLVDCLAFSALCVAVFVLVAFVRPSRKDNAATGPHLHASPAAAVPDAFRGDLRRLVILVPSFCLAVLVVFVMATETAAFKDRWLQPYLFLLPLTCFALLERRLHRLRQLVLCGIGAALATVVIGALLVLNRFPDLQARPSYSAAPFAAIAEQIRQLGFTEGTVISPDSYLSGNLLFQLPASRSLTAEYSRMPVEFRPPLLLAWEGELSAPERNEMDSAFRVVCRKPLPQSIEATALQGLYSGSSRHRYTMNVAVLPSCPA